MKSGSDIKRQFEEISSKIKQSSLPESASTHVDVLLSLFNISFEETSNQIKSLRQSIENQTQTIENQTQTINNQTLTIQNLIEKLDKARHEKTKIEELVKSLKTMLRSKNVDLDALKRLLFQGGREQKREKKTGKSDKKKSDKTDCDGSDKPKQRDRQSNKDKTSRRDAEMNRYLTMDGDVLRAETKEEATKEIPAEI